MPSKLNRSIEPIWRKREQENAMSLTLIKDVFSHLNLMTNRFLHLLSISSSQEPIEYRCCKLKINPDGRIASLLEESLRLTNKSVITTERQTLMRFIAYQRTTHWLPIGVRYWCAPLQRARKKPILSNSNRHIRSQGNSTSTDNRPISSFFLCEPPSPA